MRNAERLSIFALADDGTIAPLPKPLVQARDAHLRVKATTAESIDSGAVIEEQAARVAAGGQLDVKALQDAVMAQAVAGHAEQALARAREIAASEFDNALREHVDRIVTGCMAPRLKKMSAELKTVFEPAAEVGTAPSPETLLRLPAAKQQAYLKFGQLADRIALITSARDDLYRAVSRAPAMDTAGYFAGIRNFETVVPSVLGASRNHIGREVPAGDIRERTVWFLSRGAEFWVPTIAEQDARWQEVFGERVEEQRRNQHALNGYRALGGNASGQTVPVRTAIAERLSQ